MNRRCPTLVLLTSLASPATCLLADATTQPSAPAAHPAVASSRGMSAEQALNQRLAEFSVEGVSLKDTINALRDASGANVVVKWAVLEQAGVNPDTPVTVKVHGTTLARTLKLVLESVETPGQKLGYYIHENVIMISVSPSQNTDMVTKVYDITDLMYVIPDLDRNGGSAGGNTSGSTSGNGRNTSGGGSNSSNRRTSR